MAIVTGQELADHLGITYDGEDDQLAQAVTMATGVVKAVTHQDFESQTYTDKVLPVYVGSNRVVFPQRPVTAVSSVALPDAGALTVDVDYEWDGLNNWIQLYTLWESTATVTYTAGYSTVPDAVKAVVLSIAGRLYNNALSVQSERIDDYAVTYGAGSPGLGVTNYERLILAEYAPKAGSVIPS